MKQHRKHSLIPFFLFTTLLFIFSNILPNKIHLTLFAPFIIMCYYRQTYIACLWISMLCGLIQDLLSSHEYFGIHTLNYSLTTWIIYNKKCHFFEDSISTTPFLTIAFSTTSTCLQLILFYIFGHAFPFSLKWLLSDGILMPLLDSLYALICFTLPSIWLKQKRKKPQAFTLKRPL